MSCHKLSVPCLWFLSMYLGRVLHLQFYYRIDKHFFFWIIPYFIVGYRDVFVRLVEKRIQYIHLPPTPQDGILMTGGRQSNGAQNGNVWWLGPGTGEWRSQDTTVVGLESSVSAILESYEGGQHALLVAGGRRSRLIVMTVCNDCYYAKWKLVIQMPL